MAVYGIHHVSMKCGSPENLPAVKAFYCDLLGLKVVREWPEGIMIRKYRMKKTMGIDLRMPVMANRNITPKRTAMDIIQKRMALSTDLVNLITVVAKVGARKLGSRVTRA